MAFFKDRRVAWSIFLFALIFAIIIGQLRKTPYVEREEAVRLEKQAQLEEERAAREAEKLSDDPGTSRDFPDIPDIENTVKELPGFARILLVIFLLVLLSKLFGRKK